MSGLRCKPGELAIVVRADNDPHALGAVVTVKALRIAMGGLAWEVAPKFFWHDDIGESHEVMWDDRDLRPIRPDADKPATETEREKEAA